MTRRVLPLRPELRRSYEIGIVGGGVHGLSLAYHLAKSGRDSIAVFERSYIGAGASGRNLALLRSSWQQAAWARLVWHSRSLWKTISLELDYNVMFTERGSYLCVSDEGSLPFVNAALALHAQLGIPTRFVPVDDLSFALPQLETSGLIGAIHDPTAGISRHDALLWGYARAASRLGVHVHPHTNVVGMRVRGDRVTALETNRGTVATSIVVDCAGSGSRAVGELAGVVVPTRNMALEMFVTEAYEPFLTPVVSMIKDQCYICQTSRGEFVGGAEPPAHFETPKLATSYAALRRSASVIARRFPALRAVNVLRMWGGLIDLAPDGAGLVGELEERPGFYLDCGWGGEGYMVSVATGPLGAAYINTGVLDPLLEPFHYSRFERGERLDDAMLVVDAAGELRSRGEPGYPRVPPR